MSFPSPNPNPNPEESWTIVSDRRNRNRNNRNRNNRNLHQSNSNPQKSEALTLKSPIPWSPLDPQINDPKLQSNLLSKLQSSLTRLKSSQFYAQFLSQFNSPPIQTPLTNLLSSHSQFQFVIYGIGSIESYETARLQLSLALLIYDQLKPQISSIEVFDPILSLTECAVIEELGFTVMRMDEQARREVKVPTLFFMPHCEVHLYDNLLGANWGKEGLGRMVILGNSFGAYERNAEPVGWAKVEEAGRRVIGLRGFVREVGAERGGDADDGFLRAFHDISWHFFDVGDMDDIDSLSCKFK